MEDIVVLSVGGSLLNQGTPNKEYAASLKAVLADFRGKVGIVVGGGKPARDAANAVRAKGGSEYEADEAGIRQTHENAKFLCGELGKDAGSATDFDSAAAVLKKKKYVCMGGTIPGITTDADSALLAEKLKAKRLVNLSNVHGVFDSNPKDNPKAKKFDTMTHDQLTGLAMMSDQRKAGTHFVFDLLACKLVARSDIEVHFVDGRRIDELRAAVLGKSHSGTVVRGAD